MKTLSLKSTERISLKPHELYTVAYQMKEGTELKLAQSVIKVFNENFLPQKIISSDGNIINIQPVEKSINKSLYIKNLPLSARRMYIAPPGENCIEIDWYLQTWEYDDYGDYLYLDEMYLYSTLECDGIQNGGNNGSPRFQVFNNLKDLCRKGALEKLSIFKNGNYLSQMYNALFVGSSAPHSLSFIEKPVVNGRDLQPREGIFAYNDSLGMGEITLSSSFFITRNTTFHKKLGEQLYYMKFSMQY